MRLKVARIQLDDIIVFLLLFLSISFVVSNDIIPSTVTIALWFGVIILILLRRITLNLRITCITVSLLLLMLFTNILTDQNLGVFVKHAFSYFTVMLYVSQISFERFAKSFIRVCKFLCIVSLIGYSLHIIVPQIFQINVVTNVKGYFFSNYYIYVQWVSGGANAFRNWGIAWEPGAFATIICLALLLELFLVHENISIKNIILYVVTVFSTMSTMGIIAVICLCIYMIIGSTSISKKVKKISVIMLGTSIIIVVLFSSIFFDLSNNSVFGKIISFFDSGSHSSYNSVSVRLYSITKVFNAFFKKPLFGWGYSGLIEETRAFTLGMNTCTFLNWFAVYGSIYGCLMLTGMTKFAKVITKKHISWIIVLIFLFGITMTEDYIHCPLIYILILYGYYSISKR